MIVQLQWVTYDGSMEYYFEAPEGTTFLDFKQLCDALMIDAAENTALGNKPKHPLHQRDDKPWESWIGLDYCVHEVAAMLPEYGYKQLNFPTVQYEHGMIVSDPQDDKEKVLGESIDLVMEHNRNVQKRLDEHLEERRATSNP